jgi:beta-N-acetylhexosaminidase
MTRGRLRTELEIVWWGGGLALLLVAANLRNPYLLALRDGALPVVLVAAALGLVALWIWPPRRPRLVRGVLAGLWLAAPLWAFADEAGFERDKQSVLTTVDAPARALGRHFIVGYTHLDDVALLADRGLIAGVFLSKRAVAGRSFEALRDDIALLQLRRKRAGLPPLIIAADQEGGIVSRLSPPLTALPPLASLAELPDGARDDAVARYGAQHGRELAALGVTLNLAPVVDLKRELPPNPLDRNSLIARRAISADPDVVAAVARAYAVALHDAGVTPTLKHFPGLGRIREDTHLVAATLEAPVSELERTDWLPFRRVAADTEAVMMLAHVTVAAVDPDRPASQSRRVVDLLRKQWGFRGRLITDDLTMVPVYERGLCAAVVDALNAGVDLLLVAYDADQYFPAMACAQDALRAGRLTLDRPTTVATGP